MHCIRCCIQKLRQVPRAPTDHVSASFQQVCSRDPGCTSCGWCSNKDGGRLTKDADGGRSRQDGGKENKQVTGKRAKRAGGWERTIWEGGGADGWRERRDGAREGEGEGEGVRKKGRIFQQRHCWQKFQLSSSHNQQRRYLTHTYRGQVGQLFFLFFFFISLKRLWISERTSGVNLLLRRNHGITQVHHNSENWNSVCVSVFNSYVWAVCIIYRHWSPEEAIPPHRRGRGAHTVWYIQSGNIMWLCAARADRKRTTCMFFSLRAVELRSLQSWCKRCQWYIWMPYGSSIICAAAADEQMSSLSGGRILLSADTPDLYLHQC